MNKNSNLKVFLNGIIMENPVLVLLLGTCPTLAVTTSVKDAIGMGIAFTFVLFFSNLIISLIRKITPNEIRIPVYIITIATLVTIAQMLMKAFLPDIDRSLGRFVGLIVVNCIILGRAEAFASSNNPGRAIVDALGMSIGFIIALLGIAFIREFLGAAKITIWSGVVLDFAKMFNFFGVEPIYALTTSVGGFLIYGFVIALVMAIKEAVLKNKIKNATKNKIELKGGTKNA